jgi:hypothetical protein
MPRRIRDPELELFEDTFDEALDEVTERPKWEVFDPMNEDKVDGVHVLARAVGPFFAVDGKSQNNRYYSRGLWERVIKDDGVTDRLKRRKVFGTIGHDQDIDDKALREGKVSHILSKMWIDEPSQIGMGEVYVLNTDTGRRLNTYLRSGVELPVSSRAYGKYRGKTKDGASIVDESTYKFETFDFVQLPGIAHAVPKLAEDDNVVSSDLREAQDDPNADKVGLEMALSEAAVETFQELDSTEHDNPTVIEQKVTEESWMDTAVLTKITEDKVRIEGDLARVMEERTQLTEQIGLLRSQNQMQAKQLQQYEAIGTIDEITALGKTSEALTQTVEAKNKTISELQEQLTTYTAIGKPEDIRAVFACTEDLVEYHRQIGAPEEVTNFLREADARLARLQYQRDPCTLRDVGLPPQ